jgi:tetratricopeptide (TPR) repeat protein
MTQSLVQRKRSSATSEARRLAELARAAGLGDAPDAALEWHREAIELLDTDQPSPLLADVYRWQATVLRDRGQAFKAVPLYRQSLEIARSIGYESGIAHALNCLGIIEQRHGDIAAATRLFNEALDVAEHCGEHRLSGMLQQNLGIIADIRGNPASALAHYRVALHVFEKAKDLQQVSWVLNNLGYLFMKERRFEEASAAFDRALAIIRERGELLFEGVVEENRAELALEMGNLDAALRSIERALAIAEQRDDTLRRAGALRLLGIHQRHSGQFGNAEATLLRAASLSAIGEDALLGAEILFQLGFVYAAQGCDDAADEAWLRALESFDRIGARVWAARVRAQLTAAGDSRY